MEAGAAEAGVENGTADLVRAVALPSPARRRHNAYVELGRSVAASPAAMERVVAALLAGGAAASSGAEPAGGKAPAEAGLEADAEFGSQLCLDLEHEDGGMRRAAARLLYLVATVTCPSMAPARAAALRAVVADATRTLGVDTPDGSVVSLDTASEEAAAATAEERPHPDRGVDGSATAAVTEAMHALPTDIVVAEWAARGAEARVGAAVHGGVDRVIEDPKHCPLVLPGRAAGAEHVVWPHPSMVPPMMRTCVLWLAQCFTKACQRERARDGDGTGGSAPYGGESDVARSLLVDEIRAGAGKWGAPQLDPVARVSGGTGGLSADRGPEAPAPASMQGRGPWAQAAAAAHRARLHRARCTAAAAAGERPRARSPRGAQRAWSVLAEEAACADRRVRWRDARDRVLLSLRQLALQQAIGVAAMHRLASLFAGSGSCAVGEVAALLSAERPAPLGQVGGDPLVARLLPLGQPYAAVAWPDAVLALHCACLARAGGVATGEGDAAAALYRGFALPPLEPLEDRVARKRSWLASLSARAQRQLSAAEGRAPDAGGSVECARLRDRLALIAEEMGRVAGSALAPVQRQGLLAEHAVRASQAEARARARARRRRQCAAANEVRRGRQYALTEQRMLRAEGMRARHRAEASARLAPAGPARGAPTRALSPRHVEAAVRRAAAEKEKEEEAERRLVERQRSVRARTPQSADTAERPRVQRCAAQAAARRRPPPGTGAGGKLQRRKNKKQGHREEEEEEEGEGSRSAARVAGRWRATSYAEQVQRGPTPATVVSDPHHASLSFVVARDRGDAAQASLLRRLQAAEAGTGARPRSARAPRAPSSAVPRRPASARPASAGCRVAGAPRRPSARRQHEPAHSRDEGGSGSGSSRGSGADSPQQGAGAGTDSGLQLRLDRICAGARRMRAGAAGIEGSSLVSVVREREVIVSPRIMEQIRDYFTQKNAPLRTVGAEWAYVEQVQRAREPLPAKPPARPRSQRRNPRRPRSTGQRAGPD